MLLSLDDLRPCFEGAIPAMMATCAPDGTPNVAYLSQVEYVDGEHLALSFQFFNTTRRNVLANPQVEILVVHPLTAAIYRIRARYLRTETSGPLFENMKARLSGIASHTGMSGVFKLQGADIYHVVALEHVNKPDLPQPSAGRSRLSALRRCSERLSRCNDLDSLFETTLACLEAEFDVQHAMLLISDGQGERLYTVASRGYSSSGIGSEIPIGQGVIGVAARERTPVRISHMTAEYTYSRAIRDSLARSGRAEALELAIPWPGLAEPHSQLAVPVCAGGELVGVLFVESLQDLRFSYDDEDALVSLAAQLGLTIRQFQSCAELPDDAGRDAMREDAPPPSRTGVEPLAVRYYAADSSVFLDNDYLIKGVAGAILWKLLRDHAELGRTEFTNRELRLDPQIRLPDVSDNLEARLVLLARRLVERNACVRIEKTGRGRFRLELSRPLELQPA
jgi:adenylate cyclase